MSNLEKMYHAAKLLYESTTDWCTEFETQCVKCPHKELCASVIDFVYHYEFNREQLMRKRNASIITNKEEREND